MLIQDVVGQIVPITLGRPIQEKRKHKGKNLVDCNNNNHSTVEVKVECFIFDQRMCDRNIQGDGASYDFQTLRIHLCGSKLSCSYPITGLDRFKGDHELLRVIKGI